MVDELHDDDLAFDAQKSLYIDPSCQRGQRKATKREARRGERTLTAFSWFCRLRGLGTILTAAYWPVTACLASLTRPVDPWSSAHARGRRERSEPHRTTPRRRSSQSSTARHCSAPHGGGASSVTRPHLPHLPSCDPLPSAAAAAGRSAQVESAGARPRAHLTTTPATAAAGAARTCHALGAEVLDESKG